MADTRTFVGLDVGGTTMKAAVVDGDGRASPHVTLPTHPERGAAAGLETMCEAIRQASAVARLTTDDLTAIGVATPGMMDIARGLILDPPNLKPWRNVEVPKFIAGKFRKPVAFQNDANAAAFGEYWVGAGREYSSLVLFTLGTGVGGGIILQDRVLEGAHSHGGELGHLRIELPDRGRLCGCGRRGCLEAYASATAVVARTHEALAESEEPSVLRTLPDDEFTAEAIFDAAGTLDPLAQKIVADTAFYLGLGAAAIIAAVDPEAIVFGGGMIAAGEPFLNQIRDTIRKYALNYPAERVKVRYATLGSDAGFLGAGRLRQGAGTKACLTSKPCQHISPGSLRSSLLADFTQASHPSRPAHLNNRVVSGLPSLPALRHSILRISYAGAFAHRSFRLVRVRNDTVPGSCSAAAQ